MALLGFQDNSQWLKDQCMKMGDAYIIVYSVTDKASFEKASELRIQLRRARQSENIPIILVGNKSDLQHLKAVSTDEASAFAEKNGLSLLETSALDSTNVVTAFHTLLTKIYCVVSQKQLPDRQDNEMSPRNKLVKLQVKPMENKSKMKCCK